MTGNDELEKLIENLPIFIQEPLNQNETKEKLIEIVLDLGRRPEARFVTGTKYLSPKIISWQDLDYTIKRISKFSNENRAGIDRTLHRISCIRNRQFLINGLTCRIGRVVLGTVSVIRDLLESEKSILILGKPGTGKTTLIREIARVLADEFEKRVIIIDTSNEIAGDSDIPHYGIGRARRMQVMKTKYQHQVMIEAVENHMPQVIIIDEIGTELEVLAARTIAEKGVQLVGTTHGNYLKNLIKNPSLVNLIGSIKHVTLSDDEAKRRKTQKSILERKSYPAFEILIEINSKTSWTIHEDVKVSVDLVLRNFFFLEQIRYFSSNNKFFLRARGTSNFINNFYQNPNLLGNHSTSCNWVRMNAKEKKEKDTHVPLVPQKPKRLMIYPYLLSNNLLKEVLLKMEFQFVLTNEIQKASLIIGLKKELKRNFKLVTLANQKKIPIYSINQISFYQLSKLVQFLEQ